MDEIQTSLRHRIGAERVDRECAAAGSDWPAAVLTGGRRRVLEEAFFFTPPPQAMRRLAELRRWAGAGVAGPAAQREVIRCLCELSIAFRSFLPQWRLTDEIDAEAIALDSDQCADFASRLAVRWPGSSAELLGQLAAETAARLKAESAPDPAAAAAEMVRGGIAGYLDAARQAVAGGYVRRIADARAASATGTELGNDYAAHLNHAILLGASFVTTNPPLVDTAWEADPASWDPVVDAVLAAYPSAGRDELARAVTMEVVLANMALLRPIFLLTEGRMGYVSLQVNPKEHDNARLMVADAEAIYDALTVRLAGGVPNVVFKLPATPAGLRACEELTGRGIGVNITVNFGLYQEMAFAPVIGRGHALAAYLTLMNGRLSYPVRDELLAGAGSLAADGRDQPALRTAAAWAGVAVLKKLVGRLQRDGYDLDRVKPLVASLRWYTGPDYAGLPSPCPDVSEVIGVPVLTIFPNVRRMLDTTPGLPFDGHALSRPAPPEVLGVLGRSEIFRQAYWLPGDEDGRPERPLTLDDESANAAWPPVRNTLNEFGRAYDRFADKIMARRAAAGRPV